MSTKKFVGEEGLVRLVANVIAKFAPKSHTHTKSQITDFPTAATTSADGLMTSAMVTKLNGIAEGANKYTLPSAGSNLGGVKTGGDVSISGGLITINDDSHNHVIANVDGLQSALDGKSASSHTHDDRYYTESEMDSKLSGKSDTGHTHTVDSSLSSTSANPVQNKVVNSALAGKVPITRTVNGKALSANITLSASDVGADVSGAASNALDEAKAYTDTEIAELVNSAPETLNTLGELATAMKDNDDAITALEAVAASKANASDLTSHTGNTTVHITATERSNWNAAKTHAGTAHAPSNAEANQNAFSNVTVGSTTISADTKTDTLTLIAGSNVTLTPNATNDSVTIAAKDTVYTHPNSGVTAGTYKSVTVNAAGHVTAGSNPTTLSGYGITDAAAKSHTHTVSQISDLTATATELNKLDGMTATTAELNILDGVTATAAEINKLDGLTATTTELNYVKGVTSAIQTQLNGKAASSHSHSNYLSTSGGTVNGDLTVTGILYGNGQQAYYYNSSTKGQVFGTANATGGTTIAAGDSSTVQINGALLKTSTVVPKTTGTYYCGNSNFRWKGIYSAAAVDVSSDERLKENIESIDADEAVNLIENIDVKSFNYIGDDRPQIGVIAQDILEISPELAQAIVTQGEDGYYGVKTSDLVFPLIATVQEMSKKIEELTKEIEELKKA